MWPPTPLTVMINITSKERLQHTSERIERNIHLLGFHNRLGKEVEDLNNSRINYQAKSLKGIKNF